MGTGGSKASPAVVISLFDYTCLSLAPWQARGYEVHAYDRRHPKGHVVTASGVHLHGVDFNTPGALDAVVAEHAGREVVFAMASPPCNDLSRAGARYWEVKRQANPHFQDDAAALVQHVDATLAQLGCPYYIENPASSSLRRLWRPPDHVFEPFWFGAYLDAEDAHPMYPNNIPYQDAYTKRTGLPRRQQRVELQQVHVLDVQPITAAQEGRVRQFTTVPLPRLASVQSGAAGTLPRHAPSHC